MNQHQVVLVVNIHRIGGLRHAVVKAAACADILLRQYVFAHQPPRFANARNGGERLEIAVFKAGEPPLEERQDAHSTISVTERALTASRICPASGQLNHSTSFPRVGW